MTDSRYHAHILPTIVNMSAGKNQYSIIKSIGDGSYPAFSVRSTDGSVQLFAKYIFLNQYTENYRPDYSFEQVFAKINPIPQYSVTDRTLDISFDMAARNVHEAKNNLAYCEQLARGPYGVYEVTGYDAATAQITHNYLSQRRYIINFGTLLRDQEVEIINYDFTMNLEDGVFDYGSTPVGVVGPQGGAAQTIGERSETHWGTQGSQPGQLMSENEYVYHGKRGGILPKSITVTIKMRCFHSVALGFGGPIRSPGSLGWSLNQNLDWPHGTGPIPPADYCKREGTQTASDADILSNAELKALEDAEIVDEGSVAEAERELNRRLLGGDNQ